eukprot:m.27969 g.27969  ORF g.27969 m.27969 type:complete len:213 (+) comp14049_c0_seq1:120-758(+)
MAKLYYTPGKRGEAEAIRMAFKECNVPFEDVPCDDATKQQLIDSGDLLFGELPMLDDGGLKLVEQPAILEHVAMKGDTSSSAKNRLLGANEDERSFARSLCSAAQDLRRELHRWVKTNDADQKKIFIDKILPEWFTALDRQATKSIEEDRGLGPGVDFTFGDIAIFEVVNAIATHLKVGILRPYPNLKEWHDKSLNRPAIHKHVQSRPDADW